MLYTFSQAHIDQDEMNALLAQITPQDAVVLWQDGVLQAVKYPQLFAKIPNLFLLEADCLARNIAPSYPTITLDQLVRLTEQYYPHMAR